MLNSKKSTTEVARLLSLLIDAEHDTSEKISSLLGSQGVDRFFLDLEEQQLPTEIIEKLQAVKVVLSELEQGKRGAEDGELQ